jgi:hypothetical protein
MDQPFLLVLVIALVVALAALGRIATRRVPSEQAAGDSAIGMSTEGMKVCPRCAMGNLWTERTCINCGTKLRG